ncbi:unnamed protein product [Plasmodium vivax]|uniref:(malaria parasite P. vivax) hypothetical protein n=1 Tax=Plasmodium vivax TaxID=5855 RepID=A0A8S4HD91_PLAVI|nr:unnamed protein product [Plasmodium vivax]
MAHAKMFNLESLPVGNLIKDNEQYKKLITRFNLIVPEYVKDFIKDDSTTESRIKCVKLNYWLDDMRESFIKVVNISPHGMKAEDIWDNLVENNILTHLKTMTNNVCHRNAQYKHGNKVRKLRKSIELYCEDRENYYDDLVNKKGMNENERCEKMISWLMMKMVQYVNSYLWRTYVTSKKDIDAFQIEKECDIVNMFDNKFGCKGYYTEFRHHLPDHFRQMYPPTNEFLTGQDYEKIKETYKAVKPDKELDSEVDANADPLSFTQYFPDIEERIRDIDTTKALNIEPITKVTSEPIGQELMDMTFLRKDPIFLATQAKAADDTQTVSPPTALGSSVSSSDPVQTVPSASADTVLANNPQPPFSASVNLPPTPALAAVAQPQLHLQQQQQQQPPPPHPIGNSNTFSGTRQTNFYKPPGAAPRARAQVASNPASVSRGAPLSVQNSRGQITGSISQGSQQIVVPEDGISLSEVAAIVLTVAGLATALNILAKYTSLGSLFGIKRKKRYSKRIHKIAVKPAHDKEKKKDISYDSLDVPVRDIEYEYLIRNRDILKGLQTPKKKKSGSKTIVEIHMEVLEECKREEWELIREDFLEIVLQEFMKNESDTCESTSSNDLIGADSHNSDEMYIQKHLWHTWEDEHKHIFDKLKEKTWFHSLKKEWKREQEGLQENELSECDQLNGEQYVPFIERQKCVWGKWVSKQRIRMEQYAEVGWFDKLIEQYQKETNHYVIEETTNDTSAPKVNKTKHEADNHESCVLTKKELITKVWMLILMMVLDECKEEDDLQNRELYLDDHIGKCLKKENEETSQDISDLDRNFFERPKKKETDEYKAEMFKNLIEEAIHNKLHKNDQRDDNDVEEEDPMEKYNTDTYMLHLNDDHTNSLNGEDEESFLNGEYINPEGNYHAGSEGDTSLPSEQDQLGEIFNELKSESNELQSDNGMGKTHQMEVTDSDSSSDEDVEGKKYFIYSSMPNSPEKGGDETYATYNG